jgi:molybdate-binding protein
VLPEFFTSDAVQILFDIINSSDFKQRVETLGGYNTKNTGKVIL